MAHSLQVHKVTGDISHCTMYPQAVTDPT